MHILIIFLLLYIIIFKIICEWRRVDGMSFVTEIEEINIIVDILRTFFISAWTYYMSLKISDKKINIKAKIILMIVSIIITTLIYQVVKLLVGFFYATICQVLLLSLTFSKFTKSNAEYSILILIISLSINYILYFGAISISFIPSAILEIKSNYIGFFVIVIIYAIFVYNFSKIKRFKKGFLFLENKLENEYFKITVLNISVIILFSIIILSNYSKALSNSIFLGIIIFSIIMFITIQKSLQLYYKQKLLIQDLNETKEELQKKNKEIEQLEKENLNFSKTSHSIAHKQKSLEYKLNQLMLKNETASEIDIKERIDSISKQIYNETTEIGLVKTNIIEIDDMLKYMQSECIKHKIDFQVQLSGNIYQMINNHISKEKLEILIADHIKNAIIAINYLENTNKSILVRLGMINGFYSLYVYDSGIEFEIDTLLNLGKRPSTTHADNGGTGMGFMNTFDTLRKYKASMIIAEYNKPCKDNYTKVIKIKFDKKNEFKVCSYRSEEIKNKDAENNLLVEKLS